MVCNSSRVKVPQIQRQGLDLAEIVDWDHKRHLNIIMYELKTFFVFWDLFVFYFVTIS